jgi:hypothetical protein
VDIAYTVNASELKRQPSVNLNESIADSDRIGAAPRGTYYITRGSPSRVGAAVVGQRLSYDANNIFAPKAKARSIRRK